MVGYKLTQEEAAMLHDKRSEDGLGYYPVEDINGIPFIFQEEHNRCGLGVEAEFIPPPPEPLE